MTKYEKKNNISERFVIVYSKYKFHYLKSLGFIYLFKGYNDNTHCPFWVFDACPEIRQALDNYQRPINNNNENN